MLRTEQILNAKFTPVSKGTYSAEEVDSFLKTVAASYEESLNEKKELIKKISILADKIESYRNDEEAIKLALLDAHKMAESISKSANEKADAKIAEAESKSKILVDGANRQSTQMIDDAREKAKEIVENARIAVAALTEKAQKEADDTVAAANQKGSEIIADAEAEGKKIIGNSKESYEFFSAELEKVKAQTAKFKAAMEDLCKGQLNLIDNIPAEYIAAVTAAAAPVEEPKAEETADTEEKAVAPAEPVEAVEEPAAEVEVEESEEEPEIDLYKILDIPDEMPVAEPAAEVAAEETAAEEGDDDDLFSLIDDVTFDGAESMDSIPASLDDLVPSAPVSEEPVSEAKNEDEFFGGFNIDLDSIDDINIDEDSDDDDDITSLFDSMFDE